MSDPIAATYESRLQRRMAKVEREGAPTSLQWHAYRDRRDEPFPWRATLGDVVAIVLLLAPFIVPLWVWP